MQYSAAGRLDLSQYQLIHHYRAAEADHSQMAADTNVNYSQTARNILIRVSGLLLETSDDQPLKQAYKLLSHVADDNSQDQVYDIRRALMIVSQIDLRADSYTNYERKATLVLRESLEHCCHEIDERAGINRREKQARLLQMDLVA